MKKIDFLVLSILILTVIYINKEVIAQETSNSSSSSSSGTTDILLNKDFNGVWKSKSILSSSSSSSGSSSSSSGESVSSSSSSSGEIISGSSSSSGEVISSSSSSSSGSTSSSSGSITSINLAPSTITYKFCVLNGKLTGTIHQGGAINKAQIVEQEIVSPTEVNVKAETKDGITFDANIKLTNTREFLFTFEDGKSLTARKLNSLKSCDRPGGMSNSGNGMSGMSNPSDDENGMSGMSNPSDDENGMSGMSNPSDDENGMSGMSNPSDGKNGMSGMSN